MHAPCVAAAARSSERTIVGRICGSRRSHLQSVTRGRELLRKSTIFLTGGRSSSPSEPAASCAARPLPHEERHASMVRVQAHCTPHSLLSLSLSLSLSSALAPVRPPSFADAAPLNCDCLGCRDFFGGGALSDAGGGPPLAPLPPISKTIHISLEDATKLGATCMGSACCRASAGSSRACSPRRTAARLPPSFGGERLGTRSASATRPSKALRGTTQATAGTPRGARTLGTFEL